MKVKLDDPPPDGGGGGGGAPFWFCVTQTACQATPTQVVLGTSYAV
jgi:hypothetical protein